MHKKIYFSLITLLLVSLISVAQEQSDVVNQVVKPSRTEVVVPIHKAVFRDSLCKQRVQGGNPRIQNGYLQFDGSLDGNRQVDPQIAVGGGFVFHGTNSGLVIYDKQGNYIDGASQKCFNNGIDPKLFYDAHNKVFGFDLWVYWDKAKIKPVNIAISETSDPRGAWNIYPVSASKGVDGGGIGYSKKWIGYSFPGGEDRTFVLKMREAKSGKTATVYHFPGTLGHPVFTQDSTDDLYFFKIAKEYFVITKVTEDETGSPVSQVVSKKKHGLKNIGYPPKSPQKGTDQVTSSGDRNPKNLVLQNGFLWFSQAINYKGNSAVQWHQVKLDGSIVQTGLIYDKNTNYIQTTIGVNKNNDVLVGFQETNANMFISPRMAFRYAKDPAGQLREIVKLGEGTGATDGVAWGDYSGTAIDGDNGIDLWTIQSRANDKGRGETVIVKVPFKNK
ncbi:hypothetical protein [Aureibaculum luteum]|uniref:hypothetical protein n=1 Tax=Aureibaculum luteum TaxID=1548456 RepID=UPI001300A5CA|nr:hypothetical protein [Aureibaculum luteum]